MALAGALPALAAAQSPGAAPAAAPSRAHHSLEVGLDPERGFLSVKDTLTVSGVAVASGSLEFLLHESLEVVASEPPAVEVPADTASAARFFGINAGSADLYAEGKLKRYRVALPATGGSVSITYGGRFDFGLSDAREEYTRGFRETTGVVSKQGVYLAGSGFWYPHVDRSLVEFELRVAQPEGFADIRRSMEGVAKQDLGRPPERRCRCAT